MLRPLACPSMATHLQCLYASVQEIQAPFVLENLACSGAEQRLVDCPLDETNSDYASVYNDYGYSRIPNQCEPFAQSYAFVACGSPPAPGGPCAPLSLLCSHSASTVCYTSF